MILFGQRPQLERVVQPPTRKQSNVPWGSPSQMHITLAGCLTKVVLHLGTTGLSWCLKAKDEGLLLKILSYLMKTDYSKMIVFRILYVYINLIETEMDKKQQNGNGEVYIYIRLIWCWKVLILLIFAYLHKKTTYCVTV